MTRMAERKSRLRAETSARYRGVPLVFSADAFEVHLREKGRRTAFSVPWAAVYELGMKLVAVERRREKAEARKARRMS